jgi:uncharacterized membrane protein
MLLRYNTKSQPDGWDFLLYYFTVQAWTLAPAGGVTYLVN